MLCDSLNGKEVSGRMDTCICMAESLCCPPETITPLLISYTPIQSFFKKVIFKNAVLRDFLEEWVRVVRVGKTLYSQT